jgi:hypothetical protein
MNARRAKKGELKFMNLQRSESGKIPTKLWSIQELYP